MQNDNYNKTLVKVDDAGSVHYEGHADYVIAVLKTARDMQENRQNSSIVELLVFLSPVLLAILLVGCLIISNVQKSPQVPTNGIPTTEYR